MKELRLPFSLLSLFNFLLVANIKHPNIFLQFELGRKETSWAGISDMCDPQTQTSAALPTQVTFNTVLSN